jgi:hypothetical protein
MNRRNVGIFALGLALAAVAFGQAPAITSLSPNFAFVGAASNQAAPNPPIEFVLNVNGSGFNSVSTITWNGTNLTTYYVGPTQLNAILSVDLLATAGTVTVTVANNGGFVSNPSTFTIVADSTAPGTALRVPQVADGGGWTTTFIVENLDVAPVNYTLNIWGDNGLPSPVQLLNADGTSAALTGTLPVGGTYFLQSPGVSATVAEGWAEAYGSGKLGFMAFFKYSAPGVPDSQGTAIGKTSASSISIPYDATNGYIMGIALANSNPNQPLFVRITIVPDLGTITTGGVGVPPHGHTALVLSNNNLNLTLTGTRGTIQFTTTTPDLTALGERFTPSLSFTTLGTFQ